MLRWVHEIVPVAFLPPNLIRLLGTYVDRIAKAAAPETIKSRALDQGAEVNLKGSTGTNGEKEVLFPTIQQKSVMVLLGESVFHSIMKGGRDMRCSQVPLRQYDKYQKLVR